MLNMFKSPSYSGKNAYRYVERTIKNGREALIVSPYIDPYYASFIIKNSRGKQIYVLSSSIEKEAKRILERGKLSRFLVSLLFFSSLIDYLLYAIRLFDYFSLLLFVVVILFLLMILNLVHRNQNIHLKIPKEFVHAKMYISDSAAVHGSPNLTYKGMHNNIEHIEVSHDKEEIAKLKKQFWSLWRSS